MRRSRMMMRSRRMRNRMMMKCKSKRIRMLMLSKSKMMMSCRTIRNSWQQKPKKSKGKGKVAKAATAAKAAVKKAIKSTKKAKKAAPKEDEEEQELQAQLFEVVSTQAAAGGIILCIAGLGVIFAVLRFRSGFSTSSSEPLLVDKA